MCHLLLGNPDLIAMSFVSVGVMFGCMFVCVCVCEREREGVSLSNSESVWCMYVCVYVRSWCRLSSGQIVP